MAAHIVKPELLAQEIGQRASVNELAAVIQQPGDIRNGRGLRQRPLDLVLRVHAASMRCARSIVQLYLRVKGRASRLARVPRYPATHSIARMSRALSARRGAAQGLFEGLAPPDEPAGAFLMWLVQTVLRIALKVTP